MSADTAVIGTTLPFTAANWKTGCVVRAVALADSFAEADGPVCDITLGIAATSEAPEYAYVAERAGDGSDADTLTLGVIDGPAIFALSTLTGAANASAATPSASGSCLVVCEDLSVCASSATLAFLLTGLSVPEGTSYLFTLAGRTPA